MARGQAAHAGFVVFQKRSGFWSAAIDCHRQVQVRHRLAVKPSYAALMAQDRQSC